MPAHQFAVCIDTLTTLGLQPVCPVCSQLCSHLCVVAGYSRSHGGERSATTRSAQHEDQRYTCIYQKLDCECRVGILSRFCRCYPFDGLNTDGRTAKRRLLRCSQQNADFGDMLSLSIVPRLHRGHRTHPRTYE